MAKKQKNVSIEHFQKIAARSDRWEEIIVPVSSCSKASQIQSINYSMLPQTIASGSIRTSFSILRSEISAPL